MSWLSCPGWHMEIFIFHSCTCVDGLPWFVAVLCFLCFHIHTYILLMYHRCTCVDVRAMVSCCLAPCIVSCICTHTFVFSTDRFRAWFQMCSAVVSRSCDSQSSSCFFRGIAFWVSGAGQGFKFSMNMLVHWKFIFWLKVDLICWLFCCHQLIVAFRLSFDCHHLTFLEQKALPPHRFWLDFLILCGKFWQAPSKA